MVNEQFQWKTHPKAERFVEEILEKCCENNPFISQLSEDLKMHTSSRLFDWVDHVAIGYSEQTENYLQEIGYVSEQAAPNYRVYRHPGAQLPSILVHDHDLPIAGCAVKMDSIADFLMARGMSGHIEGSLLSSYRRCCVSVDNETTLWVVERRGSRTMEPSHLPDEHVAKYMHAAEIWMTRPRPLDNQDEAMKRAIQIAEKMVETMGQDMAAWIVLECERKYWQMRNHAGHIQKGRQDRFGMGWANHDHHTFRSSRALFTQLVRLFEILGFKCRERFYAGEEAGWGAQVMENSTAGLVLFLDVDLLPHEIAADFAHHPLPESEHLGTIGLWCALHGDSILQSSMHHLEAQFQFDELKENLEKLGVGMMEPFSNFSYLKQAFTAGEIWRVQPHRIDSLLKAGKITQEQADKFHHYGAVGSHMENLQRREGYKGFNQKNVSFIIKKTDPRTLK